MRVGKGYWVKANANGIIKLNNVLRKEEENINPINSDWAGITITDAQSNRMNLYLAEDVDTERFDLPPLPPEGAFDVRFATGKMVESLSEEGRVINISGAAYPVKIKVSGIDVSVKDIIDGSLLNASVKSGSELIISDSRINKIRISGNYAGEIPITYSMDQNYPNPFNPSTVIQFALPVEGHVNLAVFNILGERVTTLKNEVLKPGYYTVNFDATSFASGVYFYTIHAGEFIQTKKMILVK